MDEPGIVLVSTGYGVALTQTFVDTLVAKFEGNSFPTIATTDNTTTTTTPTNNTATATTANVPPIGKVNKHNFREKQSFAFIQFEDPQVILQYHNSIVDM